MVKQLGIPTWFMTLSCADPRWPELFQIISRIQGKDTTDEEVDAPSYNKKCKMLNLDPVIVLASLFENRPMRVEAWPEVVISQNVLKNKRKYFHHRSQRYPT